MDGIIIINKEKGYTSRDVVNIISKELNIKKVGHTGTLDPLAEGVLVICVGSATKLVDMITSYDKEYIVEASLGFETDTLDLEGDIIKREKAVFNNHQIKSALENFKGTYLQEVPSFSAVKINGKKLYEYARSNEQIVLPKRQVCVNKIEMLGEVTNTDETTTFKFKTNVSKGTYIRSLVRDVAYSLKTVGTMSFLQRTKQGEFLIEDSFTIDQFKKNEYKLISIKEILKDIKHIQTDDHLILNTNIIKNTYNEDKILFFDKNNDPIAVYETFNDDYLKPTKVFKKH